METLSLAERQWYARGRRNTMKVVTDAGEAVNGKGAVIKVDQASMTGAPTRGGMVTESF
jgi:hypothetical protein